MIDAEHVKRAVEGEFRGAQRFDQRGGEAIERCEIIRRNPSGKIIALRVAEVAKCAVIDA
jgi:hypothetical protein